MAKPPKQLDAEIATALAKPRKAKTPRQLSAIRTDRLKALRGRMAAARRDAAWLDTDLTDLEKWISVDDALSNAAWLRAAQDQLRAGSVLPEHAGAPPPNVYKWNDIFISTYRTSIESGRSEEEAIDDGRLNANDTIKLTRTEENMINTDPSLYKQPRTLGWSLD